MSYLDRILECNQYELSHFRPWKISQQRMGWLKHDFAEKLRRWPDVFSVQEEVVSLVDPAVTMAEDGTFNVRSKWLNEINKELVDLGAIRQTHGELYPVKNTFSDDALLVIDRAAAVHYGIKAWGQHLNGYVLRNGQIFMWIARRSKSKGTFPGKLDNMVAGGLPYGISLQDNLLKECREEASLPADLLAPVTAVSAISYCIETGSGLKPDCLFCYDLLLPEAFAPVCEDGEVDEFFLLPIAEVAQLVREGNDFKPNCDLTIIDFLLRHGLIQPDDKDYLGLVQGLRQPLDIAV